MVNIVHSNLIYLFSLIFGIKGNINIFKVNIYLDSDYDVLECFCISIGFRILSSCSSHCQYEIAGILLHLENILNPP